MRHRGLKMEIMKSDHMSVNEEILTLLLQANPHKEKVMCDFIRQNIMC